MRVFNYQQMKVSRYYCSVVSKQNFVLLDIIVIFGRS